MAQSWTKEQLQAINAEGSLLVSAAAGAGKTAVLTERIARIIADGTSVSELLVVTFTKPAAAEMKSRIEKRLYDLAESASDESEKRRLSHEAGEVSHASVSTLHSFCTNLLRRNCHEAGVDPAFRPAEDAEAALLFKDALDEALETCCLSAEENRDSDFSALLELCEGDAALCTLVSSLYKFIMARPAPFDWLRDAVAAYDEKFDIYFERAQSVLCRTAQRDMRVLLSRAEELYEWSNTNAPRYTAMLSRDMSDMLAFAQLSSYSSWYNALLTYKPARRPPAEKQGEAPSELLSYRKEYSALLAKMREIFRFNPQQERLIAKSIAPAMRGLYDLMELTAKNYSGTKAERGVIDFSDMEQLTLRVLDNPEIAREYRERYKYIFIDEYQDTSLVQDAIIERIRRSDNLFLVGDVKQSIYRFRQAEPASFLEKYGSFRGETGTRIDLNANFRSSCIILEAANLLFEKLMRGKAAGEIDYSDNAALVSGANISGGAVEIHLIDMRSGDDDVDGEENDAAGDDEDEEEFERSECEAARAAQLIREIMENETVSDSEGERPYRFSDFAVLLRATKGAAASWTNVLSAMGIPCYAELSDGYFNAIEVQVFMNLLRVIDNRRQDIPLASVMLSPIGGFTYRELIHIRSDYAGGDLLDRLIAAADGGDEAAAKARGFLRRIDDWHERSRFIGITELVGALLDETRYYTFVGALPGGAVRRANLDMLSQRAHTCEKNGLLGLDSFIRFMDGARDNASLGASQTVNADAVRIMSIHKSKGLEFPVVFIGGVTKQINRGFTKAPGVFDRELGIGLRLKRGGGAIKSVLQRAITYLEHSKQTSEEMRVLYVAMTRARGRLYMLGAARDAGALAVKFAAPLNDYRVMNARSFLDWIMGAYFPHGLNLNNARKGVELKLGSGSLRLQIVPGAMLSKPSGRMNPSSFRQWTEKSMAADFSDVAKLFSYRYPNERDTLLPSKKSVTELNDARFESEREARMHTAPVFLRDRREKLTAAERGTAAHKLIQHIALRRHDAPSIEAELRRLTEAGILSSAEAEAVRVEAVAEFFASPLAQRMLKSDSVKRELEFTLIIAANEVGLADHDTPMLLQGVIDCCFMEDGEWVLIDYKTSSADACSAQRVASRYSMQLQLYSKALQKLTGIPVKQRYIYLINAGICVEV